MSSSASRFSCELTLPLRNSRTRFEQRYCVQRYQRYSGCASEYGRCCEKMHSATVDFPYVLSEREEINSILYKPINSTQRIKYTCFNVSSSYIILGSTSGSLYLFSRDTCSFLQIIPLSEGAVSRVTISLDEKTVALATTRGIVCLVSLKPTPRLIAVSAEHIYKQITCLCWNENNSEIYVGDAVGRVSVMVLSIFTVNGMFQARAYTLMNLDSSIVQLNFSSPLLLVSTLTRCYICDTVREQYKQIGNKTRNGEFGACFYQPCTRESNIPRLDTRIETKNNISNSRDTFNFISDNDSNILSVDCPTIFCARPGSRLWEVSADGVVAKTHQFKEALAISPVAIFRATVVLTFSHEKVTEEEEEREREWLPQSVNFSHLFVIAHKYLLSCTTSGLYVVDPVNASVVLWNNEFTNISTTAVAGDKVYLMTCDGEFHCLTLSSLEALILRLYRCEEYRQCLHACILYKKHLAKVITPITDKEIAEPLELEDLLQTSQENEEALMLRLRPLITLLRSGSNNRPPAKLDSGIVVVHSENDEDAADRKAYCDVTLASQSPEISSEDSSEMQILQSTKDPEGNLVQKNKIETAQEETSPDSTCSAHPTIEDDDFMTRKSGPQENITHKVQFDLTSIYALANSLRENMSEKEVEEVVLDVDRRMRVIRECYKDSPGLQAFVYEVTRAAELHYYNTFLVNISVQLLCSTENDYVVRQFVKSFTEVNAPDYARCGCGYPYPMNKGIAEPKFLAVGKSLIARFAINSSEECSDICDKVPYMWREYLAARIERHDTLDNVLRQCLQTRDNVVLSFLLPALNKQQWSCLDMCLNELQSGTCLFCATPLVRKPDFDVLIDWSGVIREIMKRDGPDEAMSFFIKLQNIMSDVTLDKSIFQSIVFTKILHHRGMKKVIDFNKNNRLPSEFGTICSLQVRDQLAKALEKDIRQSIDRNTFGTGAHHWGMRYQAKSLICPCCTLSLQTPILLSNNGVAIFRCGHAYHVKCMLERKLTRCNLHQ